MPKGLNQVKLMGYMGKDAETRSTQGGTTIATFSLATTERRKSGDDWKDHTEWHSLTAFGRTAEVIRDYTSKGSLLLIDGRLQTRSWEDKSTGTTKYRTEIVVNELWLMPKGDGSGQQGQGSGGQQKRTNQYASQGGGGRSGAYQGGSQGNTNYQAEDYSDQGITDEDIPF